MNPKVEDEVKRIEFIIRMVAKEFGVDAADLQVRSRIPEVIEARQVVMFMAWHSYTLTGIGQALDGRTPATISHGYQVIVQRLRTSERLRRKVENVKSLLKEGE